MFSKISNRPDASGALSKIVLIFSIVCFCSKIFVFKFGARSMTNDNDAKSIVEVKLNLKFEKKRKKSLWPGNQQ